MRKEIKFRGFSKNLTNNEWFYGDFIQYKEDEFYILESNLGSWDILHDGILVEKESINQFLGIKDKNGKEIYEGDYLKLTREFLNDFKNSRIGQLMIDKNIDYILYKIEYSNNDLKNTAYAFKNDKKLSHIEILGEGYDDSEWYEIFYGVSFLRYISRYSEVDSNEFDKLNFNS